MTRSLGDGCGCFPTGRHYPGIAHLLKNVGIRGLAEGFATDVPWQEIEIALLDVETTGRDASVDRVVEVGIVFRKGDEYVKHNWLIHPGIPIPAEVSAIHHITDDMVKDKPRFEQVAAEIAEVLRGRVPAAYNAPFDRAFMMSEFSRAKFDVSGIAALKRDVEWIDPLIWARDIQSGEKSRSLGDVAARLGISLENAHRAQDDAEAALRVLYALGRDPRMPPAYGALVQEQRRIGQAQADARRMWRS